MIFPDDITPDLISLIPYASFVVDEVGRIVHLNSLAEKLFGYKLEDIYDETIDLLLPEYVRERHAMHRANYMAQPHERAMEARLDLVAAHRDGYEIPVEIALKPLDSVEGLHILVVVRDISRRRQEEEKLVRSQKQLRELTARLLTLREEERARLSRTIHNEIGQMMSGLKMDLSWLRKRLLGKNEPLQNRLDAMSDLIDVTIQTVRRMSTELRPGVLDDLGLEAAVEWQLQEFQRRTDITCTLTSDINEKALGASQATAAFRILQEALTNVARHTLASRVEVTLTEEVTMLTLVVRDNGQGITASERDHPKSIGLLGMRERARMRGGELDVQGVAGKGTTVTLQLPIAAEET